MPICTLDEVRESLGGIQSADEDGYIERLITRAGAFIDDQTGRQFIAAAETRYFDPTDRLSLTGLTCISTRIWYR